MQELPVFVIVLLIILIAVVGILLLATLITSLFTLFFLKHISKNNIAINLLMRQRYELMMQFIDFINKYDSVISEKDIANIARIEKIKEFQAIQKNSRDELILSFQHSAHTIVNLGLSKPSIANDAYFQNLVVNYKDLEELYRQKSAIYNSDVIGFNYWINISFAFLFRLMKKTTMDLIV